MSYHELTYGSGHGQHYAGMDDSLPSASTINMNDYGNISSPPYSAYQDNSNSNSNPSPPLSGSEHHYQHAPYAVTVARYDEKSSKKGYIINANKKLQLTHGPPKYAKGRRSFMDGGGPSAHDKAIIGKYRKEMRKEMHQQPVSSFHTQEHNQFSPGAGPARVEDFQGVEAASGDQPPPPKQRKPKAKKQSQYQQAKSELEKRLQDKNEFSKKKKLQKTEIEQAKVSRKQKRIERNKIQTQVTSKGQPLMKGRILNLLSKIEEQQQQQHNV